MATLLPFLSEMFGPQKSLNLPSRPRSLFNGMKMDAVGYCNAAYVANVSAARAKVSQIESSMWQRRSSIAMHPPERCERCIQCWIKGRPVR